MALKDTLVFLSNLAENNHKAWFDENRKAYEAAKKDVTEIVAQVIKGVAEFDPAIGAIEPKKAVFRIFKDVRFSKDKTPYKTNMGAWMAPGGKASVFAGYYLHLEPGGKSFVAGGSYMPPSNILKAIREAIDYDAESLEKILNTPEFIAAFGGLEGEKLKTTPKGFAKDHPSIELLRHKSFVVSHHYTDEEVLSPTFLNDALAKLKLVFPLNTYLNKAIAEAEPA
jgi:uncharacterized protein (TIGR02453 family)